ncbi:MAG: hypothetical protein WDW38_004762 [Sanguina aurantia]
MDFGQLEDNDGVRLSWNIWPNSKLEATKCVIPFAAVYTPNKRLPSMTVLPYQPIPCKQCSAVLNPYARVDYYSKVWICPFCHGRNHFPPHYQGISDTNLPAELYPSCCSIEYTIPSTTAPHPPVYLFLVDTCMAEDELAACKLSITQALQGVPEHSHVGLVTFGTHVHAYELGFTDCSKCYVFRGSKEYSTQQIGEQLGLNRVASGQQGRPGGGGAAAQGGPVPPVRKFLMPLSECEFTLTTALEELQKDNYRVVSSQRPARCTGVALQVATTLLGLSVPTGSAAAHILAFIGGPCSEGSGKVVGRELSEEIRSHKDVAKDSAQHYRKAKKFYDGIAVELVMHGHALSVFSCALDQVGMAEMKVCVQSTGGMVVQSDTFASSTYKDSLKRLFLSDGDEGFMGLSSNATFEVIPSRDIKVAGLLGSAARMESVKKSANVADSEVGLGGTTAWKIACLDTDSTVVVVFEITASSKDNGDAAAAAAGANGAGGANPQFYLQFLTKYMHWSGETRMRVTTVTRRWVDGSLSAAELVTGFDQETAAVLMARLATHKMENEEDFDATRWLDRVLIRLAQRFGDYRKDDPSSFNLRSEISFYPQFMFNLRRSQSQSLMPW